MFAVLIFIHLTKDPSRKAYICNLKNSHIALVNSNYMISNFIMKTRKLYRIKR